MSPSAPSEVLGHTGAVSLEDHPITNTVAPSPHIQRVASAHRTPTPKE